MLRLSAALLIGLSAPLQAQAPPRVQPGGVATMVVSVPGRTDSVRWTLRPAPGVRPYTALSGAARSEPGTDTHLPFTFGIPARARAGALRVGDLVLESAPDQREVRELLVDVLPRRAAGFRPHEEAITATAGASAEVAFRLRNDGNAVDTFHVRLTGPSGWPGTSAYLTLVVPPGQEDSAAFRPEVPRTAAGGEEHVLRLAMTGTGVRESRSVRLTVLAPEPPVGNLATIPGTIFVGSSSGESGGVPAAALTAAGVLRPGLRVDLALRHVDDLSPAHAFRSDLSGPRLRVGLQGDHWTASAGDVFTLSDLLVGPATHGRGLEAAIEPGKWRAELFLARPWSYSTDLGTGHIFRAAARRSTPYGTFGLRFGSLALDDDFLGASRQNGAAVTYGLRAGAHDVHAELGVLDVAGDATTRSGPAAQIRYALNQGPVSLGARLRRVPGTTARTASQGNETSLFGSYRLTEAVSLTGSAHAMDAPRLDGGPHGASRGGAVGLRVDLRRGLSARLTGRYRSTEQVGGSVAGTETRAVQLGANLPVGPAVLEAEADIGRNAGLVGHDFVTARVGARWQADRQWLWAGLSHHAGGVRGGQAGLDVAGATRIGAAEIQGGLSARLNGAERLRSTSFWSGAAVPVAHATALSLGVDFRGYAPSPWRFSLGIRRTFGMPLPVPRRPVAHGVIFEDLDGDGARGPDEPPLPNIGVSLGVVRTTTDDRGRFRFYEGRLDRLRVDPSDLPLGVAVVPAAVRPGQKSDIAVVHTASLEVSSFLDRDDDGDRDAGEEGAVGAVVSVVESDGTRRDGVADAAGLVRFSGLRPGHYTVLGQRLDGRSRVTVERTIVLSPGTSERIQLPLPRRTREIRMPGGGPLEDAPPPSSSGAPPAFPGAVSIEPPGAPAPPPQGATPAALPADLPAAAEQRTSRQAAPETEPGGDTLSASPESGSDGSRRGVLLAALLFTPGLAALWLRFRLIKPVSVVEEQFRA